jgi:hypothetical protein
MRVEHRLAKWTAFAIVPVFALANAGVRFEGSILDSLLSRPALGAALGLVLGKAIGITIFTLIGLKLGIGRLPAGMQLRHLFGVAATAGIGFTVALFITALAFTDASMAAHTKVGVFAGSLLSGVIGATIFLLGGRTSKAPLSRQNWRPAHADTSHRSCRGARPVAFDATDRAFSRLRSRSGCPSPRRACAWPRACRRGTPALRPSR